MPNIKRKMYLHVYCSDYQYISGQFSRILCKLKLWKPIDDYNLEIFLKFKTPYNAFRNIQLFFSNLENKLKYKYYLFLYFRKWERESETEIAKGWKMAVGCGAKCAKALLIIFNLIFWVRSPLFQSQLTRKYLNPFFCNQRSGHIAKLHLVHPYRGCVKI